MIQSDLFEPPRPKPRLVLAQHDGQTYNPVLDKPRLNRQTREVYGLMADGRWRTLAEIERGTGYPQASISARLRDLRKEKFGGFCVERRSRHERERGLFEYRIVLDK